jgi:hypothetical protein
VIVRGVACLIIWPMRKSSKKLPVPVLLMIVLQSCCHRPPVSGKQVCPLVLIT